MEHIEKVINWPSTQIVVESETKAAELRSILDNQEIIPEVREAYELAINNLEQRARQNATYQRLQDAYAVHGREALDGISKLEPLVGILAEEQLEGIKTQLNARILKATEFFNTYGTHTPEAQEFVRLSGGATAVAATTEVIPEPDPELDTTLEPDIDNRTEVLLTFTPRKIVIGKEGKNQVNWSGASSAHTDYSVIRQRAIVALSEKKAGEWTDIKEFWQAIGGEKPIDGDVTRQARDWFLGLTYGRSSIIEFNGKRGMGGLYRVNPRLRLEINNEIIHEQAEEPEEDLFPEMGPAKLSDLFVVANKLFQLNDVLEKFGIPKINSDWLESMQKPNNRDIAGQSDEISRRRAESLARVEEFLGDDERMTFFLDKFAKETPEYQFVEMLFDLDNEKSGLVRRLIEARIESATVSRGRVVPLDSIRVFDKDGCEILPAIPEQSFTRQPSPYGNGHDVSELEADDEIGPELASLEEVQLEAPELPEIAETLEQAAETILPLVAEAKGQEQWNEREKDLFSRLRNCVSEHASTFLASLKPDGFYTSKTLVNVIPAMKAAHIPAALDSHILGRRRRNIFNKEYSMEDALRILAYSERDLQGFMRTKKYKVEIDRIISEVMTAAQQAREQQ